MNEQTKNAPDRAGSEAVDPSHERLVRITKRILSILKAEHCTVAEAGEILAFTKDTVVLAAPVSDDWPRCEM